jgi:hypothetical protein
MGHTVCFLRQVRVPHPNVAFCATLGWDSRTSTAWDFDVVLKGKWRITSRPQVFTRAVSPSGSPGEVDK